MILAHFFGLAMKYGRRITLAILLMAGMGSVATAGPADPASSPAVYTAAQASAGAAVFAKSCAVCHGKAMQGLVGPALKGDEFRKMAAAQDLTADQLLTVVSLTMPQSDPASLTPSQYNQVVAFILQQNGYPAGNTPLAPGAAALKKLQLK
jgi:mono/diheme cytochrome c family protein